MLPQRHRRLIQRRLRRRPLLPFLLAATLAIDAVLAAGGLASLSPLGEGLVSAQNGLAALWVTHARRGWALRGCAALLLALGLAGLSSLTVGMPLGSMWTVAVTTLLVQLAAAWGVRSVFQRGRGLRRRPNGFSIGWLLLVTLLVAMLATGYRWVDWSVLGHPAVLWSLLGEGAPLAVMLTLALLSPAGWRRKALLFWVPLACLALSLWQLKQGNVDPIGGYFLIQALVYGVWMLACWGGPPPKRRTSAKAERAAPADDATPAPADEGSDQGLDDGPSLLPMRIDLQV